MTQTHDKPGVKTHLLALFCACCPFCIARRAWPNSAYGRFMAQAERNCPCCRAYHRVHAAQARPD
jgi:hypothetical protein